jgi:hypothetical protein
MSLRRVVRFAFITVARTPENPTSAGPSAGPHSSRVFNVQPIGFDQSASPEIEVYRGDGNARTGGRFEEVSPGEIGEVARREVIFE